MKKTTRKVAKRMAMARIVPQPATRPNERWSIDFIYDHLSNGTRFRSLSVIDQFSRKCLGVIPQIRFSGSQVIDALDRIAEAIGQYLSECTSGRFMNLPVGPFANERRGLILGGLGSTQLSKTRSFGHGVFRSIRSRMIRSFAMKTGSECPPTVFAEFIDGFV